MCLTRHWCYCQEGCSNVCWLVSRMELNMPQWILKFLAFVRASAAVLDSSFRIDVHGFIRRQFNAFDRRSGTVDSFTQSNMLVRTPSVGRKFARQGSHGLESCQVRVRSLKVASRVGYTRRCLIIAFINSYLMAYPALRSYSACRMLLSVRLYVGARLIG